MLQFKLTGAGECGKSTVLKQMQILHSNGFTEEEINEKKAVIYSNTVVSMCSILKAMENTLKIPLENTEKEELRSVVLKVQENGEESEPLAEEVTKAVYELWQDPGVKKAYEMRSEFQLTDSAKHFLDSVMRISEPGYRPTEQDILYSRVATTGVVEVKFKIKELDFRVFDVGGQRSERRKWIHCFDNVESIIFITAISEYDQVLFEDESTNRMIESMQLFNSICNSTWFLSTAMILFLNKKDLFMEKIQRVNITTAFPDYDGGQNYDEAVAFIKFKFSELNLNPDKKTIYMHETCATDTNQVQLVISSVIDTIIQKNLQKAGMINMNGPGVPVPDQIITLNVGGKKFATSAQTLTWIPDTFFTSLLSGRIPALRDETNAIFIDRDPDVFRVLLNYLRTKQIDLTVIPVTTLKHEAQFFNLVPLIRRLSLCEELETSSCGSVLFHGLIPPPAIPLTLLKQKRGTFCATTESAPTNRSTREENQLNSSKSHPDFRQIAFKDNLVLLKRDLRQKTGSNSPAVQDVDLARVRVIKAHYNTIVVAYAYQACVYRMKDSVGWQRVYSTVQTDCVIKQVALNMKFGAQNTDKMLSFALSNNTLHLWKLGDEGQLQKIGNFNLGVPIDNLFFIGSQMVALSKTGKVGIWQSVNQNWQVQELVPISCYDTAGSSLLLGCTNGSMYYIDMQKFPLRMKDNDLLVTELYRDPNGDCITAISVYLTPKTTVCGNWIEIAYGTSSGAVRVIVQHPETVGHGPQLFQTYTVHNSPVIRVALNTHHLISVCAEYNHVRSWAVTRFRGMISTQPGNTSLASFKVLSLDSTDDSVESQYTDAGPFGDQDGEQVFIQRVIPETNQVFVRLASTGDRICTIKTVDGAFISSFSVHECEGSSRMGNRPRRFLFIGTTSGNVQMFDLSTALDQYHAQRSPPPVGLPGPSTADREQSVKPASSYVRMQSPVHQTLAGPSAQELLQLIDECDICCSSNNTPALSPHTSNANLSSLT